MNNTLDIEISKEQKKKFTIDRQHKLTCFFPEEDHKHLFHRLETPIENTIVDLLVNLSISLREENTSIKDKLIDKNSIIKLLNNLDYIKEQIENNKVNINISKSIQKIIEQQVEIQNKLVNLETKLGIQEKTGELDEIINKFQKLGVDKKPKRFNPFCEKEWPSSKNQKVFFK